MTPLTSTSDLRRDPGYAALKAHVIEATGLAYYADKDDDLIDRLARRMQRSGRPDCDAYLLLLRDDQRGENELDRLAEELTVGETSFFRHAELFAGLRHAVLPDLIARNRASRRLRIWSAGCSIGAEAYSLAILLARDFAADLEHWDVSILGTDINRQFLGRARDGVFRSWDLRGMDPALIDRCFERRADTWIIRPEYGRWVSFQSHNLVRHPFPALIHNLVAFDLILCRNVLIYFDHDITRRLIRQFHDCLTDAGWLLVGHAEPNVDLFRAFRTVNVPGAVLYQKSPAPAPPVDLDLADAAAVLAPPAPVPDIEQTPLRAVRPAAPEVFVLPPPAQPASPPLPAAAAPPPRLSRPDERGLEAIRQMADAGDLDAALRSCDRAIAAHPLDALLHLHLAMLAEQLGQSARAQTALRRTIYLDPDNVLAHYFRGLHEQKHGRFTEALHAYRRVQTLLARRGEDDAVPGGEHMTVRDLRELTAMQEEVLAAP